MQDINQAGQPYENEEEAADPYTDTLRKYTSDADQCVKSVRSAEEEDEFLASHNSYKALLQAPTRFASSGPVNLNAFRGLLSLGGARNRRRYFHPKTRIGCEDYTPRRANGRILVQQKEDRPRNRPY